jgi:membrane protease YdiL (CAAX protease family)
MQPDQPLISQSGELVPPLTSPRPSAVVDLRDVALVIVVAFFLIVLCTAAAVAIAATPGAHRKDIAAVAANALVIVPAQVIAYLLTIAFMAFLVSKRHHSSFGEGILWNLPDNKTALTAFAGGMVMALVSQLSSGLLQRWTPKNLPIEEYFKNAASGYALAMFGIFVAPVMEELFFRGFLYPALARWTGAIGAIVMTAAAFSLLHGAQLADAWVPLLVLFLVGAVLTTIRARTHSVATCVLVHMGYNATLFSIMFIYTQGFRHMEKLS